MPVLPANRTQLAAADWREASPTQTAWLAAQAPRMNARPASSNAPVDAASAQRA